MSSSSPSLPLTLSFPAPLSLSTAPNLSLQNAENIPFSLYTCPYVCLSVYNIAGLATLLYFLRNCLSVHLSVCLSVGLSIFLPVGVYSCLPVFLCVYLSFLSAYQRVCLPVSVCLFANCLSRCLALFLQGCLSFSFPIFLSVCIIYNFVSLSLFLSFVFLSFPPHTVTITSQKQNYANISGTTGPILKIFLVQNLYRLGIFLCENISLRHSNC